MAQTSLVVGIGNPLQGADGFGPAVIASLRASASLPPDTQLIDAHTDLLALIDRFAAFDQVVLVDAVLGDGRAEVIVFDEPAFAQWPTESPSSHQVSALVAVGLFRRLYPEARTRISLVGLNVDEVTRQQNGAQFVDEGVAAVQRLIAA
jgi:hydrogenase maturation protease